MGKFLELVAALSVITFYGVMIAGTAYLIYWKDASPWIWLLCISFLCSVKYGDKS